MIVEKRSKEEPCISEASIKLRVDGESAFTVGEGDGPVDALNVALRRALSTFSRRLKRYIWQTIE